MRLMARSSGSTRRARSARAARATAKPSARTSARPADRHPGRPVLRPQPPLRDLRRASGRGARARAGDGVRLSVLDQSPIAEGSTGADALRNTIDLARLADALGYHRYWVAEHHGGPMLACAEPGGADRARSRPRRERIRVGSGGVMLPHYSPLKVAENFSLLAGLYPGRIDLGLGRAPGTDPMTMLRAPARPPPGRARRLPPAARRAARLPRRQAARRPPVRPAGGALPGRPERPELVAARLLAAERDLGRRARPAVRVRRLHQPERRRDRRALPRALRRPSGSRPRVSVAVWAICAETDEEAERLASSGRMAFSLLRQGRLIPVPPPEKALRFLERARPARHGERRAAARSSARPRPCARGSRRSRAEYGAEEVIVVTITHDHAARRRSYELIAEAFDLGHGLDDRLTNAC